MDGHVDAVDQILRGILSTPSLDLNELLRQQDETIDRILEGIRDEQAASERLRAIIAGNDDLAEHDRGRTD